MRRIGWGLIAAWALVSASAHADVVLPGAQHLGDQERADMTPVDPVRRAQMASNPSRFLFTNPT